MSPGCSGGLGAVTGNSRLTGISDIVAGYHEGRPNWTDFDPATADYLALLDRDVAHNDFARAVGVDTIINDLWAADVYHVGDLVETSESELQSRVGLKHKADSYHYVDKAIDLRAKNLDSRQIACVQAILPSKLPKFPGGRYVLLLELPGGGVDEIHFHLQWADGVRTLTIKTIVSR